MLQLPLLHVTPDSLALQLCNVDNDCSSSYRVPATTTWSTSLSLDAPPSTSSDAFMLKGDLLTVVTNLSVAFKQSSSNPNCWWPTEMVPLPGTGNQTHYLLKIPKRIKKNIFFRIKGNIGTIMFFILLGLLSIPNPGAQSITVRPCPAAGTIEAPRLRGTGAVRT